MKRLTAVLTLSPLLLLAGCSAAGGAAETPTATPKPTASVSANVDACKDFAALVLTVPGELNSDTNANDMWEGVRVKFDTVALTAEGVVQDRMLALVDDWPDLFDITIMGDYEDINGKFEAVDRACEADGVTVDIGTFTSG